MPARYQLRETGSSSYRGRTRRNVLDSDGTVIFTRGRLEGGSALTANMARAAGKPVLHVDLSRHGGNQETAIAQLRAWLAENQIRCLNVAGSRESKERGIQHVVAKFLVAMLGRKGAD